MGHVPPRKPGSNHYGNAGARVPQDMQARIIELCRQGVARNEIARQTGVARASISGICDRAGVTFDRSAIANATAARTLDLRHKRQAVSAKFLERADALLDEMNAPFLAFSIGGKDNIYTEQQLDHAPTGDKRNLMTAASTAIGRHLDLEQHDIATAGVNDIRSMLGEVGRALGIGRDDDA